MSNSALVRGFATSMGRDPHTHHLEGRLGRTHFGVSNFFAHIVPKIEENTTHTHPHPGSPILEKNPDTGSWERALLLSNPGQLPEAPPKNYQRNASSPPRTAPNTCIQAAEHSSTPQAGTKTMRLRNCMKPRTNTGWTKIMQKIR